MPRESAKSTKERLERLKEYLSDPSRRKKAYALVAEEYGVSIPSIKVAASRAGLTSKSDSLRFCLSSEEEGAFVAVCLKYAHRRNPLTIPVFIELASRFTGCEEAHKLTRHFVTCFIRRHKNFLCLKPRNLVSSPPVSDMADKQSELRQKDYPPRSLLKATPLTRRIERILKDVMAEKAAEPKGTRDHRLLVIVDSSQA